jgi:hypothetical protein
MMLLLAISLAQQAFHPIAIMRSFENALAHGEHYLHWHFLWQFGEMIYHHNRRRFDALSFRVYFLNNLLARQALRFGQSLRCTRRKRDGMNIIL